jgi:hypothetical protein
VGSTRKLVGRSVLADVLQHGFVVLEEALEVGAGLLDVDVVDALHVGVALEVEP